MGSPQALLSSLERRDRQLLDALRDDLHVVLWFEHDLYDQLQLLDVLALAHTTGSAPELIVIGSFPGKPSFAGLGELTASELETLWSSRLRATPGVLEAAASAWAALQAPEPTALAEWATRPSAHLPFVAPALRRLLEELPAPADGLSRTERSVLQTIAAGARTPPASFVAAQRLEEAPFLGDTWFHRAVAALGQGTTRLLERDDGEPLPPPPPLGDGRLFARLRLRLTPAGERTLRGEADRVKLLGIDRWIGGTHVTPDTTWRWDTNRHEARSAAGVIGGSLRAVLSRTTDPSAQASSRARARSAASATASRSRAVSLHAASAVSVTSSPSSIEFIAAAADEPTWRRAAAHAAGSRAARSVASSSSTGAPIAASAAADSRSGVSADGGSPASTRSRTARPTTLWALR